jgi:hypothetical protein
MENSDLNYIYRPHEAIDALYVTSDAQTGNTRISNPEHEIYKNLVKQPSFYNLIPNLYHQPQGKSSQPNTLVKFTGIVQDIFGSEFMVPRYQQVNLATGEKIERSLKYHDSIDIADDCEFELTEGLASIER